MPRWTEPVNGVAGDNDNDDVGEHGSKDGRGCTGLAWTQRRGDGDAGPGQGNNVGGSDDCVRGFELRPPSADSVRALSMLAEADSIESVDPGGHDDVHDD